MELQNFIDNNDNYIDIFKNHGLRVKTFSKYNLILVKYSYNMEIDMNSYQKYCRGCIIDTNNKTVVFVPPCKADNINIDGSNIPNENFIIQDLYDGTMINLFYHNDKWIISSRSDIDCNNKWNNQKSFKTLFQECGNINLDLLNKNHTYSFVMQHVENRNVSHVNENCLILVEEYDRNGFRLLNNIIDENFVYNGFQKSVNFKIYDINQLNEYMNMAINNPYFSWKGYTIKGNNTRINYINPLFTYVKNLKINSSNMLFSFCELLLKNDGSINNYIQYFPEHNALFMEYFNKYNKFIDEVYKMYVDFRITKQITLDDIPFHIKPVTRDLHGIYLSSQIKINKNKVIEYIKNLPSAKLTFHLKNY